MYSSIYRVQSSTRRLPIQALFGFTLKLVESYFSPSPQSLSVVVCPWYPPWVASLELESNHLTRPSHTRSPSLIRKLYPDSRVKELSFTPFTFVDSQPLVPCSVAHLGLSVSSYRYLTYYTPAQGRAWCLKVGACSRAVRTHKAIET